MNYLKVYCNLIRKAENRTPPEGCVERHHTFPKGIFGDNNRIVVLTPREHYIAHLLLEKIYIKRYGVGNENTRKMTFTCFMMRNRSEKYNSNLYEKVRKRHIKNLKEKMKGEGNPRYGKPGCKGEKNGMYGRKRSGELNPRYGKKHKKESKDLISKTHKEKYKNGYVPPNLGKKLCEKQVLSMSKEFCVISPEGQIFRGINQREFARNHNIDQGGFNRLINGKHKYFKGWRKY